MRPANSHSNGGDVLSVAFVSRRHGPRPVAMERRETFGDCTKVEGEHLKANKLRRISRY